MQLRISATKTNLIKTKKMLSLTREGHQLLDEKRKILMNELAGVMESLEGLRKETDDRLAQAYAAMEKAVVRNGHGIVRSAGFAVRTRRDVDIVPKRMIGVTIPALETRVTDAPPYFGTFGVDGSLEEARVLFCRAMETMLATVEKRAVMVRIAREVQKTVRKVNALEKVHIPEYQQTVAAIADRLEEDARESFALLKIVKEKLALKH